MPGLTFSSALTVNLDTTGAANTFDLTATSPTLTIAGQSFGADNVTVTVTTVTDGHTVVEIAVTNLTMSLGSVFTLHNTDHVSGALIIDNNGIAGQFSAATIPASDFAIPGPATFAVTGGLTIKVNTGSAPVNTSVGGNPIDVPGNDIQVVASGATLTVGSTFSLGGPTSSFAFDRSSDPPLPPRPPTAPWCRR